MKDVVNGEGKRKRMSTTENGSEQRVRDRERESVRPSEEREVQSGFIKLIKV